MALGQPDLIVGADGINSLVRQSDEEKFGASVRWGRLKYVWLGCEAVFDAFTFIFRRDASGLYQAHIYPYSGTMSTVVVMCDERTFQAAGLGEMSEQQMVDHCNRIFAGDLNGARLLSNRSNWLNFPTLTTGTWHVDNCVLVGDSAHTAHPTIGSGTKLAMEDAIALARAINGEADLGAALAHYELERRPVVERFQEASRQSEAYFEAIDDFEALPPLQFAFNLLTRSGRIDYDSLRLRDPRFVDQIDAHPGGGDLTAPSRPAAPPSPMTAPFRLREVAFENRVVGEVSPSYTAVDGCLSEESQTVMVALSASGVALVMSELAAVSAEGRITPGCPGAYRREHGVRWTEAVEAVRSRSTAKLMLRLGHAGRRGSTASRERGLDRPLQTGGWPLMAPSPLAYTTKTVTPREMSKADIAGVRDQFRRAAAMASEAGFDVLLLHMAHGYLLGSFLSPLSNQRSDEYGGDLEGRTRFPLEVLKAAREEWPDSRPLAAAVTVDDWAPGGLELEQGMEVVALLKDAGCDLIQPLPGQTIPDSPRATYSPDFLIRYSERIRNRCGIATLTGGYMVSSGELNTVVAGGRADLCVRAEIGRMRSGS